MSATGREYLIENRIVDHIKSIAAAGDKFRSADAEALCRLLSDMPVCRAAGFELTAKPVPDTMAANDHPVASADLAWEVGIADRQFGPYVVTRTGEAAFVIRHAEDRHAFIHDDEEMLLCREAGRWSASLNRPRPLDFGLFKVFIGRHFEPWKRSA